MKKYIQITEGFNPICVIEAETNNQLKELIIEACGDHFSSDDVHFVGLMPDLKHLTIGNRQNINMSCGKHTFDIRLDQTWFYKSEPLE